MGCSSSQNIIYSYYDGNGNKYVIDTGSSKKVPIKPEQSSTGFYSGGEYKKKNISYSERKKIIALLNNFIKDNPNFSERKKGDSKVIKARLKNKMSKIYTKPNEVIIKHNSKAQNQIKYVLKRILNE